MVIDYLSYEEKKWVRKSWVRKSWVRKSWVRKAQAYASALLWTLTGTTMANTSYQRIAKAYIAKKK